MSMGTFTTLPSTALFRFVLCLEVSRTSLLFAFGGRGAQYLYVVSQWTRWICFASAAPMVSSFPEQHDSNRVGLGGHAVPSIPEVQECHHVGRPGFIKYYFLLQSR